MIIGGEKFEENSEGDMVINRPQYPAFGFGSESLSQLPPGRFPQFDMISVPDMKNWPADEFAPGSEIWPISYLAILSRIENWDFCQGLIKYEWMIDINP